MTDAKDKQRLFDLVFGHMATQTVATAARLKVVDTIGDGELTSTELAATLGTDAAVTIQLCRALAALGVLSEVKSGQFRVTGTGALSCTWRAYSTTPVCRP